MSATAKLVTRTEVTGIQLTISPDLLTTLRVAVGMMPPEPDTVTLLDALMKVNPPNHDTLRCLYERVEEATERLVELGIDRHPAVVAARNQIKPKPTVLGVQYENRVEWVSDSAVAEGKTYLSLTRSREDAMPFPSRNAAHMLVRRYVSSRFASVLKLTDFFTEPLDNAVAR